MVKNPWIPAPLFVEKEEEEKVEKVNEEVAQNEVLIKIGKISHSSMDCYLRLIFEITKEKVITSLIQKKEGSADFQNSARLKLENNEFKYLHRKCFKLILVERSGFLCCKKEIEIGEALIRLDSIKSNSHFENEYEFKTFDNNQTNSKIFVSFNIRQPTIEKEYVIVSKTEISITKTFPPFKGENISGVIDEEEKPKKINENVKVVKKPEVKQQQQEKSNQKSTNPELKKKQTRSIPEVEYKISDFKPEELENPDIIENLTSIKVLNFKIGKIEEEIKKIEGRAPQKIREKLIKMKVTKNVIIFILNFKKNLEAQMGSEISINMYLGMLRYQLDHDRKLLKYFQDKKDGDKTKLVAERIPVLIAEIEEAVDYMTKK